MSEQDAGRVGMELARYIGRALLILASAAFLYVVRWW